MGVLLGNAALTEGATMGDQESANAFVKALGPIFVIVVIPLIRLLWKFAVPPGVKVLIAGKEAILRVFRLTMDRISGIPDSSGNYDSHYAAAFQEINSNTLKPATWAKAFAHSVGDGEKAKALYIKYRVEQLKLDPCPAAEASSEYRFENTDPTGINLDNFINRIKGKSSSL
jgi:hypothetical protein